MTLCLKCDSRPPVPGADRDPVAGALHVHLPSGGSHHRRPANRVPVRDGLRAGRPARLHTVRSLQVDTSVCRWVEMRCRGCWQETSWTSIECPRVVVS